MFILETNIGNYGTYKDLWLDMKHRDISEVQYTCKYMLSIISKGILSFDEVTKLYMAEKNKEEIL